MSISTIKATIKSALTGDEVNRQHRQFVEAQEASGVLPGRRATEAAQPAAYDFPEGLADCFVLLNEARNNIPKNGVEMKAKDAYLSALEAHIMAKQNGPPVPNLHTGNFLAERMESQKSLPTRIAERFQRVREAALKGDAPQWPAPRTVSTPLALLPHERLRTESVIQKTAHRLVQWNRRYVIAYLAAVDLLDPQAVLDGLKREIVDCKDLERIRAINREILERSGATASDHARAADATRVHLRKVFEPARQELIGLLVCAQFLLAKYLAESVDAEKAWFGQFGIAPERTEMSRRIEQFRTRVDCVLEELLNPTSFAANRLPSIAHTPVDELLGVKLVE